MNTKTLGTLALAVGLGVPITLMVRARLQQADVVAKETHLQAVPTVSVVRAKKTDPKRTVTLPGNIEAWFQAPIYAQVSGYVRAWHKDFGAEVKKGDVLAEVNAPALEAQLKQAKADMEAQRARAHIAELTAKRYGAMRASNAVPAQAISVVEADAQVEMARLSAALQHVRSYEAQMRFTTIEAPYDGVVVSREINVGDYVNKEGDIGLGRGQAPLFMVADVHRMRLFVSVPETFGQFMREGLEAKVSVPQLPDRSFVATFLTTAKGFRTSTRTVVTEFTLDNADRALWPGSYASVELTTTIETKSLTVPATALVFDEGGAQLAVVTKDQKVTFKPIKVAKILDSEIEVLEGISLEDAIVDNPSAALLEGDLVRVVSPRQGYAT